MGFMLMVFAALLFYIHGASSSPYVSTVSMGYTRTESGSPSFACYESVPHTNFTVTTGRYVNTYFGRSEPANDPPPPSTLVHVGNPPAEVYQTRLSTFSHGSYGVFYCAATSLVGRRTVVPTIFLRSDAKFVPSNGRFSKTVSKGDGNVLIDFTEVKPRGLEKVWRFNDTKYTAVLGSSISRISTNFTIPGEVDTSHAGIYEIYLGGERGKAKAGLLRLIVRACPAGRYNASSGCVETCPSCYNGGVCHDETGGCICPPGFKGSDCGIPCGGNHHGRYCEYRCAYDNDNETACSGLQVCVPDPYGCSCTPGYKGLDCTTECERGEFGASCTETCRCVSGECDRFTGVCPGGSSECLPGWTGLNCQVPSGFSSPLIVSGTTNDSVTLMWGAWNESKPVGDPPVMRYSVLYRLASSSYFQVYARTTTDLLLTSETVTGLSPGTDYVFAVAAVRPIKAKTRWNRLEVRGRTKCSSPDGVPLAITASSSTYPRTIQVSWQDPPTEINSRCLIGFRIYWEAVGSPSISSGSVDVPLNMLNASISYNLTSLEPYTRYRVSASMLHRDAEGRRSEPAEAMTAEESAPPPSEIQSMVGSSFIILKWNASTPAHLNGNLKGYTINYTRVYPPSSDRRSELIKTCQVISNIYVIEGVREGETYEIQINTVNGVGSGEWSAKTSVQIVGPEGFSLITVLLSSIIPSAIALICIITVFILIFRKRASDNGSQKLKENEKKTTAATHSPVHEGPGETYESVGDDEHTYHELVMKSVKSDESYLTVHAKEQAYQIVQNAESRF